MIRLGGTDVVVVSLSVCVGINKLHSLKSIQPVSISASEPRTIENSTIMRYTSLFLAIVVVYIALAVGPSYEKTECEMKREAAERLVRQQERNQSLGLAIVVPKCNEDGTYARLQCHHNSQFCQCWDKDGSPLTQPKKNLKKCACLTERAMAMKAIPPSQTDRAEITTCETDGAYTAKQCNRSACWCVNPETGKKLGSENSDKSRVKC